MTTAVRPGDLRTIAELLEERLHAELPDRLRLQIRCAYRRGNLLVLGEHPPDVHLELQPTFRALQNGILSLLGQIPGELRLYLRAKGQKQPYAYHAFRTPQPVGAVMDATPQPPILLLDRSPTPAIAAPPTPPQMPLNPEAERALEMALAAFPLNPFDSPPPDSEGVELSELPLDDSEEEESIPRRRRVRKPVKSWLLPFSAMASIALVVGSATFYVLSRPCAIGTCPQVRTANELTSVSANLLENAQYKEQIVEAREQILAAMELLQGIPPWSGDYQNAQRLLQKNRNLAEGLDEMVEAMDKGLNAVAQGKNPPHPAEVWQNVAAVWSEAIALLEAVPADSPVYSLALDKLPQYRANLTAIQGRIKAEQTSAKQLQETLAVAKVAQARSGAALSYESWETIYANWENVIAQLEALPEGTIAHQEAAKLLPNYRAQLDLARDRKTKEKIAADAYDTAILEADRAEESVLENQWSAAVTQWTQAIVAAEQVPEGTVYYPKAVAQLKAFKAQLDVAQAELRKANILAKARADLKRTCEGKPTVCEYTVTENAIGVWLSAQYLRNIQQTATIADRNRDAKVRQGLDVHVTTLRTALEAISDNANIPLDVYDPYGSLIGRHAPNRG